MGDMGDMGDEETIFTEALAKESAGERAAFLDRACGGDAALRARVDVLLAAHDRAGGFLESPPAAVADPTATLGPGAEPPRAGAAVGPYRLLEQIGEGGMGVVFMAEQVRPVRRRVALKVIKLGMDTKQVVARFEAERQALALMDHPGIARVLDAGATDAGRPYFVMELVRGVPITDYCDAHRLTARQRLGLFAQVCQAVQHAHQKGVIHRDLKPTNVLVTELDGKPVPKVIDFGIAKATDRRLTEKTVFTEFRQMIGTPAYMSPEQAGATGADVDTRSDVYSLGVLLYELLTGTTPFDARELRSKAYGEIQRIIREVEPPKPSTRLSTMGGALTAVAEHRNADPGQLRRQVRADLDWIVMRCLEKDRGRRYETADGLARDVGRYLDDEPVQARPTGAAYRACKFVRRHKAGAAAVAAVAAALVVGTAGTTAGMLRARSAQKRAQGAEATAVLERNDAVTARKAVERATTQAVAARQEAEGRSRELSRALHASNMGNVQAALQAGDADRAIKLLHEDPPSQRGWEWSYLSWATEQAFERHVFDIPTSLPPVGRFWACSRDGRRAAVSHADGTVSVWDESSEGDARDKPDGPATRPARTFRAYPPRTAYGLVYPFIKGSVTDPPVWTILMTDDGRRIITFGIDDSRASTKAKVWDADTSRQTATLAVTLLGVPPFHPAAAALSGDGTRLVGCTFALPGGTGTGGLRVCVWDLASGEIVGGREAPGEPVALALSRDGRRVAGIFHEPWVEPGRRPTAARLLAWDIDSGAVVLDRRWSGDVAQLGSGCLAISGDGKYVSAKLGEVTVWGVDGGREVRTFKAGADSRDLQGTGPAAMSDDGRLLATSSFTNGRWVAVWDVATGERVRSIMPAGGDVTRLWFSPDGRTLYGAGGVQPNRGPDGVPAPGGSAAVRAWDVWDDEVLTLRTRFAAEPLRFVRAEEQSDAPAGDRWLLAVASGDLTFFDAGTGRPVRSVPLGPYTGIAFDSRRIATTGRSGSLSVYDAATGQVETEFPGVPSAELRLCADGAGRAAVCRTWGGTTMYNSSALTILDLARAAERARGPTVPPPRLPLPIVRRLGGVSSWVHSLTYSPEGRHLAVNDKDGNVCLIDATTGRLIARVPGVWYDGTAAFSPDGSRLAVATMGGTVVVLDTAGGRETLRIDATAAGEVAFTPDGGRILTGEGASDRGPSGGRGPMKLWDATSGAELLTLPYHGTHPVFSPDGRLLAFVRPAALTPGDRTPAEVVVLDCTRPVGDARRSRRDVTAQGRALAWLETLWTQGLFGDELRRHIEQDRSPGSPGADEAVRAAALAMADDVHPRDAARMQEAVWADYGKRPVANPTPEQVRRNLALARTAVRVASGEPDAQMALGMALYHAGDFAGAIEPLRRAEELDARTVNGVRPRTAAYLALAYHRLGEADQAIRELARGSSLAYRIENRPIPLRQDFLGRDALFFVAEEQVLEIPGSIMDAAAPGLGNRDAAAHLRRLLEARRRAYGPGNGAVLVILQLLARACEDGRDEAGTEAALREGNAEAAWRDDAERRTWRRMLIEWLVPHKRKADAEAFLRQCLAPAEGLATQPSTGPATWPTAPGPAERSDILLELADVTGGGGNTEPLVREALDLRAQALGPAAGPTVDALLRLAALLVARGGRDEAEALLLRHEGLVAAAADAEADVRVLERLRDLHAGWKPEQVAAWRPRLVAARRRMWLEQIDRHTREIEKEPNSPLPLSRRALVYAKSGRFREAIADYQRVLDLDPRDDMNWYSLACLLAYVGDADTHRIVCRDAFVRFAVDEAQVNRPSLGRRIGPDGSIRFEWDVRDRLAKGCLLVPGAAEGLEDPALPMRWVDWALAKGPVGYVPWFQMSKGIAEYRAGHSGAAADWLAKAAAGLDNYGHAAATCGFFRAMALRQAGNAADARQAFDAAERGWGQLGNTPGEDDLASSWLACQIARREARAVFGKS